jgi:hypothetical protein
MSAQLHQLLHATHLLPEHINGRIASIRGQPVLMQDLHLHHPEVAILFQRSMRIAPEEVQALLALPHDTLAADLRAILRHAVEHFHLYEEYADEHGWQWDVLSAPLHALVLLGELPGGENLEALLSFLGAEEAMVDFHLSDQLMDDMWEPIAKLARGHFATITRFVRTPCPHEFARIVAAEAMRRLAWTWPEEAPAVQQWYQEQLVHFAQLPDGDPALDETLMGALVSDCVDQNFTELLPEIETLFRQGRVAIGYCGDWPEIQRDMQILRPIPEGQRVLPLAERYASMLEVEQASRGREEEMKDMPLQLPERGLWDHFFPEGGPQPVAPHVRESPKVGRNDPCPCGSGKKYKKCCGG